MSTSSSDSDESSLPESSTQSSSSSSSSGEDMIHGWDQETLMFLQLALAATCNSSEFFNANENEDGGQPFVNPAEGVRDQLSSARATPAQFKNLTNFTLDEFEDLCLDVCPTIAMHARTTGELRVAGGRPYKLTPEQRILSFLMFLKHDNTSMLDAFHWNWSKTALNDDAIFVASCINEALQHEIEWPDSYEREELGQQHPDFEGCIGFIDGTLVKIRRPYRDPDHSRFFNGRKKIYAMNNTVVVDHNGLFIYIDPGYPGSFHDVSCLRASSLDRN